MKTIINGTLRVSDDCSFLDLDFFEWEKIDHVNLFFIFAKENFRYFELDEREEFVYICILEKYYVLEIDEYQNFVDKYCRDQSGGFNWKQDGF